MPLTTQARASFIALMPHLAADEDTSGVLAFVRDNWRDCLDEVAAQPGFDQVRTGLVRILRTELASDPDVDTALRGAVTAVGNFLEALSDGDATLLLSRHPAWVGLCALELAEWDGSLVPDALEWAINLAGAGFSTLSGIASAGRGEVLWALAEQAEDVGWMRRAHQLIEASLHVPFADPEHRVRVQLLCGMRRMENGEFPAAQEILEEVASSSSADAHTRTHARALLSEVRGHAGDIAGARQWLSDALNEVDPDEEPEVHQWLRDGMDAWEEDGE